MTEEELLKLVKNDKPIKRIRWNDPDPIQGNDYNVTEIYDIAHECCMINYGGHSQAMVYIDELELE